MKCAQPSMLCPLVSTRLMLEGLFLPLLFIAHGTTHAHTDCTVLHTHTMSEQSGETGERGEPVTVIDLEDVLPRCLGLFLPALS